MQVDLLCTQSVKCELVDTVKSISEESVYHGVQDEVQKYAGLFRV
jgi:hypothetical protein